MSSLPYMGAVLTATALAIGIFVFGGILCYGVFGSFLYVVILAFVFISISTAMIFVFWIISVVMWALSVPAGKIADKELKFRGFHAFLVEFLTKLVNSALSKETQQDWVAGPSWKDSIAAKVKQIHDEVHSYVEERKKIAAEKAIQEGMVTAGADTALLAAPAQQDMKRTVALQGLRGTRDYDLDFPIDEEGRPMQWKPHDQTQWYSINSLQTPAHYLMHDGDSVCHAKSSWAVPDADACKSNLDGTPQPWKGKVQMAKNASSAWYMGMIVGPLILFFVLGAAQELPKMADSLMLTGYAGWLECGQFSYSQISCHPQVWSDGPLQINGCDCLLCSTFHAIDPSSQGYAQLECPPVMGGCAAVNSSCFGFHTADFYFPQDQSGFCNCASGTLTVNATVTTMEQSNPIWSNDWLHDAQRQVRFGAWKQIRTPSTAMQIVEAEWNEAGSAIGRVNRFLHFLFVDTVLRYFHFAVMETHRMIQWLDNHFYKAETFYNGVAGWLQTHNRTNSTESVDDIQVNILAGRAGIAAAVGLTALHHH